MRTDREPSLASGMIKISFFFAVALLFIACARRPQFDVVLRNGRICDGTGALCVPGGIAINGDTIAKVGDLADARGRTDLDVHGLVIAPGFINMMSGKTAEINLRRPSVVDLSLSPLAAQRCCAVSW